MEPLKIEGHSKKGWMITHRCIHCGHEQRNKAALNDEQSDDFDLIIQLTQ